MNSENPDAHEPDYTPSSESRPPKPEQSNPLDLFKPSEGYRITPILIWLNVGVFILMALTGANLLQPAGEDLIRWGANYTPLTLEGQPWRLLTNCFVHIGIIHLAFNMYALVQIGSVLEPLLGERLFSIAYLAAGLLGSVVSLWWHDVVLGAGASGAIFGLYGVFLALLTTNWLDKETRKALLRSILIFVGYNLMIGLQAGIDNAAHIGGLIAGLLFGYNYYFFGLRTGRSTGGLLLIAPIITCLLAGVLYAKTDNAIGDYDRIMKKVGQLEEQAMSVFQLPRNTPASGVAKAINDRGIGAWQQSIKLLEEADKLKLPEALQQRNNLLRQYSTLRLKSFELLQHSLVDTTHIYDSQIEEYDRQIQSILNRLKTSQK